MCLEVVALCYYLGNTIAAVQWQQLIPIALFKNLQLDA